MPRRFPQDPINQQPAPLTRRLAAMLYDGMICIALLIVVAGVYTMIHQALIDTGLLAFDRYADIMEREEIGHDPILFIVLFGSVWWFFGYFWRRNGQTLGMQVWLIRVQNDDGTAISWSQAFMRMLLGLLSWATLGLGYLWVLWSRNGQAWTDRWSDSVTVRVPKPVKKRD